MSSILKVKHFIGGASHLALEYLDEDINRWLEANNIQNIENVQESFGQSPVGMNGNPEGVVFISIWYRDHSSGDTKRLIDRRFEAMTAD
ncbi:MAG TPA: hypothetical protein VK041_09470 [Opitutales bacterium]|nr:hypothetical protein [Opitutales bacterium]